MATNTHDTLMSVRHWRGKLCPVPTTRTAPGTPRDRTRAQQAQTHTYAGSARNTSHRVKHFTPTFTPAKTLHTTLRACSAHPPRSPAPLTRPAGRSRADANDAGAGARRSPPRGSGGRPVLHHRAPAHRARCGAAQSQRAARADDDGRRCTRWRANSRADASARRAAARCSRAARVRAAPGPPDSPSDRLSG